MLKRGVALLLLLCMALPCAAAAEQADARRVVYLTFDDGPKKDTPELLDALETLDVPATFFLVGLGVRAFPDYARQIVQAGHAVGCHTMGHAAGAIKKDEDFVLRDIGRFNRMMSEEIEPGFSTDLFRFPGGSSSYKARIKAKVRDAGYAWFDWNTMTGDAQYSFSSDREMLEYTLGQAHGKDVVILLMHEGKTRTRRILPELVAYFRENGYESGGFPRGRRIARSSPAAARTSCCPMRNKEAIDHEMRMSAMRNVYDSIGGHRLRLRLPGMFVPLPGVHGHEHRRQPGRPAQPDVCGSHGGARGAGGSGRRQARTAPTRGFHRLREKKI